jgi:hypothetical protein
MSFKKKVIEIAREKYEKTVKNGDLESYRLALDLYRRVILYSVLKKTEKEAKFIEIALSIVEGYSANFGPDSVGSSLPLIADRDREDLKNGNFRRAIEIILEEIAGEYLL